MYLKLRIGVQQNGGPTKLTILNETWWNKNLTPPFELRESAQTRTTTMVLLRIHRHATCAITVLVKNKGFFTFWHSCVGDLSKWLGPWQGANDIWRDQAVSRSRSTLQLSWGCQHVGCEYQGTSSAQASMKNTQVKLYLLARHVYFCNGGAVWSGLAPSIFASPGLRVSCCNAVVL